MIEQSVLVEKIKKFKLKMTKECQIKKSKNKLL